MLTGFPRRLKPTRGRPPNRSHAQMRNLIAWWPCWEGVGETVYDVSGYGNDATIDNLRSGTWASGDLGTVLDLPGGAGVTVGSVAEYPTGASERTITFWFNAASFDTGVDQPLFQYAESTGSQGEAFIVFAEDQAISVAFLGHRIITPKSTLFTGTWYHVAVRVPAGAANTGDTEILIDGIEQTLSDEAGGSQTMDTQNINVHFGDDTSTLAAFEGDLFDLRIYDRGLSDAEVRGIVLDPWAPFQYRNNVKAFGGTAAGGVAVGLATSTELAQPVTSQKTQTVGQAIDNQTAFSVTPVQDVVVGLATSSELSFAVTSEKLRSVNQAIETDAAQGVTSQKTESVNQAVETDTTFGTTVLKEQAVGQAIETNTAFAVTAARETVVSVGQAVETNTPFAVGVLKEQTVGQATETDTSFGVTSLKEQTVGQAVETNTAFAVTVVTGIAVNQAVETSTAFSVTGLKEQAVGQAAETNTAFGVTAENIVSVGQAVETETAFAVTVDRAFTVGQAVETDSAPGVTSTKVFTVGQAVETDLAFTVTAVKPVIVTAAFFHPIVGQDVSSRILVGAEPLHEVNGQKLTHEITVEGG